MISLSVVISAYNEESSIKRVLTSVAWVSEVIVVNNESSDATAAIAKKMGAKVITLPNNLMLNKNKNAGFLQAKNEWILNLDADEEIPPELKKEIEDLFKKEPSANGYWIPRKNIIFGKWIEHGLWWPDKQLRLFRREKGSFPSKHVHEYIDVVGDTGELQNPFTHYNYETVSQFIRKMDTIYTENEVENLLSTDYHLAWFDAIRFPLSDFVKVFFAQEGYKDGLHGLVLSLLQSFYSLVVFAKLWERNKFEQRQVTLVSVEKELTRSARDIQYWLLTSKIKHSSFPLKLWLRARRWLVTHI